MIILFCTQALVLHLTDVNHENLIYDIPFRFPWLYAFYAWNESLVFRSLCLEKWIDQSWIYGLRSREKTEQVHHELREDGRKRPFQGLLRGGQLCLSWGVIKTCEATCCVYGSSRIFLFLCTFHNFSSGF